jgi:hypothetical protein
MRRVMIVLVAALGCSAGEPAAPPSPPPPPPVDASRPDPPAIDAAPVDARAARPRGEVTRRDCLRGPALERIARQAWGAPTDATIEVDCAPTIAPDAAWTIWGHASQLDRHELHVTVVTASHGPTVIADWSHRTTDATEVDASLTSINVEPFDLDSDGIEEQIYLRAREAGGVEEASLTVLAIRDRALVAAPPLPLVYDDGRTVCRTAPTLVDAPPLIHLFGKVKRDAGTGPCPKKGAHRYVWDPAALVLRED